MPRIFAQFETNLEFLDIFSCKSPIQNITEIRPLGHVVALELADKRTDMAKLGLIDVFFRDYVNVPTRIDGRYRERKNRRSNDKLIRTMWNVQECTTQKKLKYFLKNWSICKCL